MKKEIEVWVTDTFVDYIGSTHLNYIPTFVKQIENTKCFKAKLIIEIPEKKIEITESEWEEARDVWDTDLTVAKNLTAMKRKLFGDELTPRS